MPRIAIIGGGPIGVEAALYGAVAGFDVHLYERGRLCENVRAWGHIGLFTEWQRNRSPLAVHLLTERGLTLPPGETTSTGEELATYVQQLAALPPLQGRLHPQCEVLSVTRERALKSDFYGDSQRAHSPFRLVIRSLDKEVVRHADAVIDATGVYATPNPLGNGGAPCPGERALVPKIDYWLPDVAGRDRARFANKHTLVVGSGHSAASTLRGIAELFDDAPQTRLTWVVRRNVPAHGFPYTLDAADSSAHRDALHRRANELSRDERVAFLPRTVVDAVESRNGRFIVTLLQGGASGEERRFIECDNIACHTGFRADPTLWSELQVLQHPATGGPFGLSETIMETNRLSGVGLSTGYAEKRPVASSPIAQADACGLESENTTGHKPDARNNRDLLLLSEPNFFVVGIKSYGRDAGFLMQNGFRQVRDVYQFISGHDTLDLYNGALD